MFKKISCLSRDKQAQKIKVRIIKAPLVNTQMLRSIVMSRQRAIVLD